MHNKPTNRWLDVQITIVTLVMTLSLGLWNLFASKSQPSPEKVDTQTPATADPSQVQPTTIYFSSNSPQAPQVVSAPSTSGSGSSQKRKPVTHTQTSRP